MEVLILNLKTETYFVCRNQEIYNAYLRELLHKIEEPLIPEDIGTSIWSRQDKIIIVPMHLVNYVKHKYSEVTY